MVGDFDIHKKALTVVVTSPEGIIAEHNFLNVHDAIDDFIQVFLYHGVRHMSMESTAGYWHKLGWKLSRAGFEVLVANPQKIKTKQ